MEWPAHLPLEGGGGVSKVIPNLIEKKYSINLKHTEVDLLRRD